MKNCKFVVFLTSLIVFIFLSGLSGCATTQPLSKEQIDTFSSVRTVQIVVNQSYGNAKGVSLPFEDVTKRLLKYAGLKVVTIEDSDLKLEIKAKGMAIGLKYSILHEDIFLYTGAFLSGSISLEAKGTPVYKKSFNTTLNPPSRVKRTYRKSPARAPFEEAFGMYSLKRSFLSEIVEMIGEVYNEMRWIEAMEDENWLVRSGAALALGKTKNSQAIKPLIAALKDENWNVRGGVALALDKLGWKPGNDAEKIDYLIAKQNWKELKKVGKLAVEPLIAALEDENWSVRTRTAYVLGEIKDPRAIEPLIGALKDESLAVQGNAAWALGMIGDPRAVEPLIVVFNGENQRENTVVFINAWRALRKIGPPAVESLIVALKDENFIVSLGARMALGGIKDYRAVEPLIGALVKGEKFDNLMIEEALRNITGKDFGEDPVKWQKWWEKNKDKFLKGR